MFACVYVYLTASWDAVSPGHWMMWYGIADIRTSPRLASPRPTQLPLLVLFLTVSQHQFHSILKKNVTVLFNLRSNFWRRVKKNLKTLIAGIANNVLINWNYFVCFWKSYRMSCKIICHWALELKHSEGNVLENLKNIGTFCFVISKGTWLPIQLWCTDTAVMYRFSCDVPIQLWCTDTAVMYRYSCVVPIQLWCTDTAVMSRFNCNVPIQLWCTDTAVIYRFSSKFSVIYLSTCPASAQKLEQIKNKNICFHVSCQIRQTELRSVTTQKTTEQSF
jgi:hypothetical protein